MQQTKKCARLYAVLLSLCLVFAAPPASANPNNLESLTVAIVAAKDMVLSPLSVRERDPLSVLALCYEGLVNLDDQGHPQPGLAERWDAPGENSNRWIFYLRNDVTFHNGKPMTAHDVVATLDYIFALGGYNEERKSDLPEEERGVYGNLVAYISSWKAEDDYTLHITAARRYYGLLNAMTFPVLPAEEVATPSPPGTGPYKIEQYEPGDRIWLTANLNWWKSVPSVLNVVAYIYPDSDTALNAFDAGKVSIAMTRSLSATRYSGSMRSFSISYQTRQVEMLLMHHNTPALGDENVRRAIISAIDRSALAKQVYQNMATPVTTPVLPGTWLYDEESATQEDYDPVEARRLLDDGGWPLNSEGFRVKTINGTPTQLKLNLITYEEPSGSVRRSAAAQISEMLAVVGIQTNVQTVTYERALYQLQRGGFDLALCGMNFDVVPDFGFMLMSNYVTNYCRYKSDTMTSLIKNIRNQADENAYKQAMSELQHQFVSDAPFMCLYTRTGALLTRDTFTKATVLRELELLRGLESW